jgi:hypothetical protein
LRSGGEKNRLLQRTQEQGRDQVIFYFAAAGRACVSITSNTGRYRGKSLTTLLDIPS